MEPEPLSPDERQINKNFIKEYIISCIDKTLHYRNTSLRGTHSKFKVGYTPKSYYTYLRNEKKILLHFSYVKEIFVEVYDLIKHTSSEEKRKEILQASIKV